MYTLIEEILSDDKYASLDIVSHLALNMLIKDSELLNEQEKLYATHLTEYPYRFFNL